MATLQTLIGEKPAIAHLATSVDGRPHVAPVWYGYEDGTISVVTGGEKRANIRQNPRVSVSIQNDDAGVPEWRVVARGTATVVDDVDAINQAARWIYPKYIGNDIDSWAPVYRSAVSDDPNESLIRISVGSTNVMS
jgi:nitroimidazol reductase NimA-like FMN-containing flavoprotein (pyridoxamine 5'-phosphate oxidase superfamily)